ncbi:hypothetical protein HDU98_009819 [Podochytrium sp. JEL0797]|nr:hypothetical protein HDU98_009819 [Podochytrium sp. JEL0797]
MAWNDLIPEDPQLKSSHLLYLALGGFITAFGLVSLVIKDRLYMSEAMVAILFGVLIGPIVGNLLDVSDIFGTGSHLFTLEFTRLVILIVVAIQCMACGVDLPGNYLWREKMSLAMLLGPVMVIKWIVSAVGMYWIMGLSVLDSLVISACITPTDPVLANSIVKGKFAEKHVPLNVRLILSAESGANDGLGFPFLLLPIYLARLPAGQAVGEWVWKVVIYQIILSMVIGAALAYCAKRALKIAERRDWIDKESILSFSIALTLFLVGVVSMIGSDDIFAVFIAGNVLTWDLWFNKKISSSSFQEVIDGLLNLTYFIFIGSIVPWSSFTSGENNLELWRLCLLGLWVIVLRRVPIVMGLYWWIPALKTRQEAFFAAWFGPIGAGAIFYAHIAVIYFDYPASPILPIIYFIVLCSVVVHGGSVALFNMSLSRTTTYSVWEKERKRHILALLGLDRTGSRAGEPVDLGNARDAEQGDVVVGGMVMHRFKAGKEKEKENGKEAMSIDGNDVPTLSEARSVADEIFIEGEAVDAAAKGDASEDKREVKFLVSLKSQEGVVNAGSSFKEETGEKKAQ